MKPTIHKIKRTDGIAGQFAYDVSISYPGEPVGTVGFVGNAYSESIYMVTENLGQSRVDNPERFGPKLNEEWITLFFTVELENM